MKDFFKYQIAPSAAVLLAFAAGRETFQEHGHEKRIQETKSDDAH
jgi:hypothetical protein